MTREEPLPTGTLVSFVSGGWMYYGVVLGMCDTDLSGVRSNGYVIRYVSRPNEQATGSTFTVVAVDRVCPALVWAGSWTLAGRTSSHEPADDFDGWDLECDQHGRLVAYPSVLTRSLYLSRERVESEA